MMMRRSMMLVALALLLPLPALAQGGGQGRGGMGSIRLLLDQGSVAFLLTRAADLQLTADQQTKFTEIAAAFDAKTKVARDTLRTVFPAAQAGAQQGQQQGQQQGGRGRGGMQAVMPHMEALRAADEAAVTEALALLSEAHRTHAQALLQERQAAAGRGRGRGGN